MGDSLKDIRKWAKTEINFDSLFPFYQITKYQVESIHIKAQCMKFAERRSYVIQLNAFDGSVKSAPNFPSLFRSFLALTINAILLHTEYYIFLQKTHWILKCIFWNLVYLTLHETLIQWNYQIFESEILYHGFFLK